MEETKSTPFWLFIAVAALQWCAGASSGGQPWWKRNERLLLAQGCAWAKLGRNIKKIGLFTRVRPACRFWPGDAAKGGCLLSDIIIWQRVTGKVVGGQAEYQVNIENKCSCPQANVKVRCYGVDTVEYLDKTKIRPIDKEFCIIADGKPITKGSPVTFTYAFQTPQGFIVVTAKPQC